MEEKAERQTMNRRTLNEKGVRLRELYMVLLSVHLWFLRVVC